ncbi:Glycoside hydrolase [Phytophthora megakarya]|uniref:Glycoside hydrolase n=1 Tax=Phytophthora megakarya TaxID=4795 RepID=A0A225W9U5_9STRA|nr:Glycoside hydrolase [Phytophthora megakarya]
MKLSVTLAAFFASIAVSDVQGYTNPVIIKNYKMFDAKTGAPFAVKGIDYYPRPNTGEYDVNNLDMFTDTFESVWSSDIDYLAATGANAVRLYAVDPSKSHDKFMCALRAKGMYALIDLAASCRNCSITLEQYPTCYPAKLKSRGEQIILAFAKYDNVLAFSAGNEINNEVGMYANKNAPCQKKFIRDMRAFVEVNAKYYNCRTLSSDSYENAEWYGINAYQYCDNNQKTLVAATGFNRLQTEFASYKMTIPVMLTEYGCLNEGFPKVNNYEAQRTWLQAQWLYSSDFRKVFSGGFVFEYSTENANSKGSTPASEYPFTNYGPQNYGLGYYSPMNCDHKTVPCVYNPMPNYNNLAVQYNATDISSEGAMSAFTPDSDRTTIPTCPSNFSKLADITWESDSLASLSCPSAVQAYTCPNQVSSGVWATDNGSTGGSGSSSSPSASTTSTKNNTTSSKSGATRQFSLTASAASVTLLSAILSVLF